MATALGGRYVNRPVHDHAKAGNLKHALATVRTDLVAVFEAGHGGRALEGSLSTAIRPVTENLHRRAQQLDHQRLAQVLELARPQAREVVVHGAILPVRSEGDRKRIRRGAPRR